MCTPGWGQHSHLCRGGRSRGRQPLTLASKTVGRLHFAPFSEHTPLNSSDVGSVALGRVGAVHCMLSPFPQVVFDCAPEGSQVVA